jgi:hypothetical protein
MELTEELATLCRQAAEETDTNKLLDLTKRINELLEKQENQEKQRWKTQAA